MEGRGIQARDVGPRDGPDQHRRARGRRRPGRARRRPAGGARRARGAPAALGDIAARAWRRLGSSPTGPAAHEGPRASAATSRRAWPSSTPRRRRRRSPWPPCASRARRASSPARAFERLYRDTPLMIIGEGTNEIQRLIITRNLLDRYGERLGRLDLARGRARGAPPDRPRRAAARGQGRDAGGPRARARRALPSAAPMARRRRARHPRLPRLAPSSEASGSTWSPTPWSWRSSRADGARSAGSSPRQPPPRTSRALRPARARARGWLPAMTRGERWRRRRARRSRGGAPRGRRLGPGRRGDPRDNAERSDVLVVLASAGGRRGSAASSSSGTRPAWPSGRRGRRRRPARARGRRPGARRRAGRTAAARLGDGAAGLARERPLASALAATAVGARPGGLRGGAALLAAALHLRPADLPAPGGAAQARRHGDAHHRRAAPDLSRRRAPGRRCRATTSARAWPSVEAAETASMVTLEAMRIHGGYGYTNEFPVERLYRDAARLLVTPTANETERRLVAREVVAQARRECPPHELRAVLRGIRRRPGVQALARAHHHARPTAPGSRCSR